MTIFRDDFQSCLIVKSIVNLALINSGSARRFYHILESNNISLITKLWLDVKSHVMKALAALSKYLVNITDSSSSNHQKLQLKWSNGNNTI